MVGFSRIAAVFLSYAAVVVAYDNTIYLIRHGEKPSDGSNGLSAQGEERAQCLRNVFAAGSQYDIGYIMAQAYKSDGSRERPYETVLPLAGDLGLTVDVSCDRDDSSCVEKAVKAYAGTSNSKSVLICWEHDELTDIADALGVKNPPDYPSDSYNLIWTIQDQKLVSDDTSEDCPGLDSD
ncbi:hypothetical protein PILCRDRAFT_9750 [Piloderma croceum F 1598]|uniref:Phosphoglycerate mutase family protein n=1 Tax=Piloderma croceum (strain F 1598) TaxID=765440 RepID=A0A0C3F6E6_PILCF|nr:hypothetical protein PILCRDRAFT_9750 [Piloderma croceum F 1598]